MKRETATRRPIIVLALGVAICLFLYWPGLSGPLVLDDQENLADVTRYLEGDKTAWAVVWDNRSGRLGRPVSMATFVADAWLWGDSTWHAKRTNLVIHTLNGALIFLLLSQLIRRSGIARERAALVAAFLAATWLILPVHASTVLYLVQRMAQLSTLFMLLGLFLFVQSRIMIEEGRKIGTVLLWTGVPIALVLGMFSKENAALLPLLALVVELVWFRPQGNRSRQLQVWVFFAITALLPLLAGLAILLQAPDSFLSAYRIREFNIYERLLTQSRVLWDYVQAILLPRGSLHGIFHDDYLISRSLFSPWTTFVAVAAWLGALLSAFMARNKTPLILGGVLIFLVGQSIESSIFPLELYFEHRNYFPSIGILMALAGVVQIIVDRWSAPGTGLHRVRPLLAALWFLSCLAVTFNQVAVWSDADTFYRYQNRHHPESMRLHSYMLALALKRGDFIAANAHIDAADRVSPQPNMMAPAIWRILAFCSAGRPPDSGVYTNIERRVESPLNRYGMIAVEQVAQQFEGGDCAELDLDRFSEAVVRWLNQSELSGTYMEKWRTKYYLSRMYASTGAFDRALEFAEEAWKDSGYNRGIGVYFFQINASVGNRRACERILGRLEKAAGGGDLLFNRAVETFRRALENDLQSFSKPEGDLVGE